MDHSQPTSVIYTLITRSIEETLLRMYYAVDTHQFDLLTTRVFANEITTDYSAMFGWEPQTRTAAEQTERWRGSMTKGVEVTQHLISGFLPLDLEPSMSKIALLETDQVTVHANVSAYLRKRKADGEVVETRNAGRGEYVMQKKTIAGASGEHVEWRVRSFKAFPVSDIGGKEFWSAE